MNGYQHAKSYSMADTTSNTVYGTHLTNGVSYAGTHPLPISVVQYVQFSALLTPDTNE
jgi:hypothetical protein